MNKVAAVLFGIFAVGALRQLVKAAGMFSSKPPHYGSVVVMFVMMLLSGYFAAWAWQKKGDRKDKAAEIAALVGVLVLVLIVGLILYFGRHVHLF